MCPNVLFFLVCVSGGDNGVRVDNKLRESE